MRAADLLFETLRLRQRRSDAELRDAWSRTSARGLERLADYERAHAWILRRLRETGADRAAPSAFVDALASRARDDAARALLVDAEASSVLTKLEAMGVACVLL